MQIYQRTKAEVSRSTQGQDHHRLNVQNKQKDSSANLFLTFLHTAFKIIFQ